MSDKKPSPTQEKKPTPVHDAYAAFVADRQAANVTASTLAYYRGKLRPFIVWCEANGAPRIAAIANLPAAKEAGLTKSAVTAFTDSFCGVYLPWALNAVRGIHFAKYDR